MKLLHRFRLPDDRFRKSCRQRHPLSIRTVQNAVELRNVVQHRQETRPEVHAASDRFLATGQVFRHSGEVLPRGAAGFLPFERHSLGKHMKIMVLRYFFLGVKK